MTDGRTCGLGGVPRAAERSSERGDQPSGGALPVSRLGAGVTSELELGATWVALGSNLGDREAHIVRACGAMARAFGAEVTLSPLYATEPMYLRDQPEFLNGVATFHTALAPEEVLLRLLSIETELGRTRTVPNGPRVIDLDLLGLAGHTVSSVTLTLPHPRLAERLFVLVPWDELDGRWTHPETGLTVRALRRRLISAGETSPVCVHPTIRVFSNEP